MKTVGKQLQEARLAKNWTPELAARETKIKVDRLRDLETDDYSHFTSPTYARGFVRTYARSLGLDEYKILRQLDNKLPDDDSANIVTDTGVAYLPETAMPPRAAHRDYTGYYIVMGLGGVVMLIAAFVLLEAYRVGELSSFFDKGTSPVVTTPASGRRCARPSRRFQYASPDRRDATRREYEYRLNGDCPSGVTRRSWRGCLRAFERRRAHHGCADSFGPRVARRSLRDEQFSSGNRRHASRSGKSAAPRLARGSQRTERHAIASDSSRHHCRVE
jgi:hypothetical protein